MDEAHPLLIYATLGVSLLVLLAQAAPKVFGPVGKALTDWGRSRREARIENREADIVDVQRQVEYLTDQRKQDRLEHERERARDAAEQEKLRKEFAEHRRLWAEREARWAKEWRIHRRWDYDVTEALIGHEPPFDPSPPFMTPDPPKE